MPSPDGAVLVRSVYRGRVRWAFPHRLVADGDRLALYLGPGTPGVSMGRDPDGRYLERWVRGDDPHPREWHSSHVLKLVRPSEAHTVELVWDEEWGFICWYVNLQAPLTPTPLGFDTTDWALDVVVEPDGTVRWKDEDDFAEARALGIFTDDEAAAVRAEGERVLAARPWPTGWEDWRPDPSWTVPQLPANWDRPA